MTFLFSYIYITDASFHINNYITFYFLLINLLDIYYVNFKFQRMSVLTDNEIIYIK